MAAAKREWTTFRSDYPGYIQGVAVSESLPGGCRVLIVAEPPEHVSREALTGLAPALMGRSTTHQRAIGSDGWVKDLVVMLPPAADTAVDELVDGIHYTMHASTYGAAPIPYGAARGRGGDDYFLGADVDLKIAPQELLTWLTDKPREATDPLLGTTTTVAQLLADPDPGVYHSGELILWPLPYRGSVDDQRSFARRFAVDSDLIVGGLLGETTVVVVGRQRAVPLHRLPPLRPETLLMLAGAQTDELQQSFEGQRVMTGKLQDGSDWMPAMLSPTLHDTEFGGLLNIADVMIKAWSINGLMEVKGYEWYPKPDRWPFVEPISYTFRDAGYTSVVYNWNTKDRAVALIGENAHTTLTFNGTGALRPEYFPGGARVSMDIGALSEAGFEYFRTVGDPTMVRISQYVSFYQLARIAKLSSTPRERLPDTSAQAQVLTEHFKRAAAALRAPNPPARARLVKAVERIPVQFRPDGFKTDAEIEDFATYLIQKASEASLAFESLEGDFSASEFSHDLDRRPQPGDLAVMKEILHPLRAAFLSAVDDQEGMLQAYRQAGAGSLSPWMHTPTLVRCRRTADRDMGIMGGHNVSSHVRVALSGSGPSGRPEPIFLDGGAAPDFLMTGTIRAERDGLKRGAARQAPVGRPTATPRPVEGGPMPADRVLVERRDDGTMVTYGDKQVLVRNQYESADRILTGLTVLGRRTAKSKIRVELAGFSKDESDAIWTTLDIHRLAVDKGGRPSRLTLGKGVSRADAERFLDTTIDGKGLKIGELSKPVEGKSGGYVVEATVETGVTSGGKPLSLKVKLFTQRITESLTNLWQRTIARIRGRVVEEQPSVRTIVDELHGELARVEKELPGMKFEIGCNAVDITLTLEDTPAVAEERTDAAADPA